MESMNLPTMQMESASGREPGAGALYGPGGYEKHYFEKGISGVKYQKIISEEMARSELEAMERDALYALRIILRACGCICEILSSFKHSKGRLPSG